MMLAQVTSNVADPLETLRLDTLKRFIKLKNWQLVATPNDKLLIYEGPVDDNNHPIKLALPTSQEFEDAPSMILKALRLLAEIESCSVKAMGEKIMSLGSDFLRPRIISTSSSSSISYAMATKVIKELSGLIYYSACLEEDAQPFFAKGRKIGTQFLERCRFGQTFYGSFGITIEMPISPPHEISAPTPFERRIMMRIAHGIIAIRKAVHQADVSILTNDYKQGFNANLYETMTDVLQSIQDCQLEFSFAWSPEYSLSEELQSLKPVRFTRDSFLPFLESAAKTLRQSSESQDTLVTGKIVQLRGNRIEKEELDDTDAFDDDRMIVIEWEAENGKLTLIRSFVSTEEYKLACDAHRDGKCISIRGKPEKLGKYLVLTSSSDFKILEKTY